MRHFKMKPLLVSALCVTALAACGRGGGQEVGHVTTDWTGNEIKIEAVRDPDMPGIVCHMTYFDRSVIDRLRQGNWFEDPSNTSISCQRIGAIDLSHVNVRGQDEVFSHHQSLFFKSVVVRRIFDIPNRSVLYVSHGREIVQGSAKMGISSVALTDDDLATLLK